jgi:hypothetical protein
LTHHIVRNMYLAAILELCLLTHASAAAVVPLPQPLALMSKPTDAAPLDSPQEPSPQTAQPERPAPDTSQPSRETGAEKAAGGKTSSKQGGDEKTGAGQPQPQETPGLEGASPGQKTRPKAGETPKSASKTPARKRRPRRPPAAASDSTSEKKVVRNGGTADPVVQLSPSVSNEQASRQRQSTTQLLATTDANLKQLAARQLDEAQQGSVSQIRKYMEQAKTAESAGDVQRAQNLASKALLLSDDLVKH